MHARARLDITSRDLLWALGASLLPLRRAPLERRIERRFEHGGGAAVCCLSVRSGLDLVLQALALPPGSEVLVSALTIPDMARVVRRHGLVPVPVDVDLDTLAPRLDQARELAGPRTRALLVAHLFGTRVPMQGWIELAHERGWLVLEDCAQSFAGLASKRGEVPPPSDPRSDCAFFSFGPIKTATALGGGVALLADRSLAARVRALRDGDPPQARAAFALRALKYLGLLGLTRPLAYGLFARALALRGRSLDEVVSKLARGFPAEGLFERLRRRPCAPQLALLERRLACFDQRTIEARRASGDALAALIDHAAERPGAAVESHHWVFPLLAGDPLGLRSALLREGFDATRSATLSAIAGPAGTPPQAARFAARVLYLPAYARLGAVERERLAAAILRSPAARPAQEGAGFASTPSPCAVGSPTPPP